MEYQERSRIWTTEQLSRTLSGDRDQWMPRGPVIDALAPRTGETLLDVGAGLGWLTIPLASLVGESGRVWGIDPSSGAVDALSQEGSRLGLPQLSAQEAFAENIPLPDQSVDGIVWHTVALHMGDRTRAIRETYRLLKPQGRWVVVDWKRVKTESGPPLERRIGPETIIKDALDVGLELVSEFEPGPVTWGLVWRKP